jgi:hypothetical protein
MEWFIALVILVAGSALSAVLRRLFRVGVLGGALVGGASYLVVGLLVSITLLLCAPSGSLAIKSVNVLILTVACSVTVGFAVACVIWLFIRFLRSS